MEIIWDSLLIFIDRYQLSLVIILIILAKFVKLIKKIFLLNR